jgi:hypothetical protein
MCYLCSRDSGTRSLNVLPVLALHWDTQFACATCACECRGASLVDFETCLLDDFGNIESFVSCNPREMSFNRVEYVADSKLKNKKAVN